MVVKMRMQAVKVRTSMSPRRKSLDLKVSANIPKICRISRKISQQEMQKLPNKPQISKESNKKKKKKSNLNHKETSLKKTTISSQSKSQVLVAINLLSSISKVLSSLTQTKILIPNNFLKSKKMSPKRLI